MHRGGDALTISAASPHFLCLFRVRLIVAGSAKAYKVAVRVSKLWKLVCVLDVVYHIRLPHPAVPPAFLALVSIPAQDGGALAFPAWAFVVKWWHGDSSTVLKIGNKKVASISAHSFSLY